jgi:hypothetical protein
MASQCLSIPERERERERDNAQILALEKTTLAARRI